MLESEVLLICEAIPQRIDEQGADRKEVCI